ncbi:PRC-barrel domain-containing protein [Desulfosarcina ovata]|uniref:PRC-barrel domain-containing protein n=1 Tax=Desulfosarcina ovata subsp. ovata TaxID=2752305 RepID=A0A5K8AK49_9BACT|nr:PRC-barrel domain-containing protein [Desulfosarcina ovata]BBO93097.1 hypothetical protein DSCOOX_62770 [Desulfosarcina ovata subsp. ovata]
MEIPVGVDVICGTAVCGCSKYLVINPVNDQVTHLVVAEKLPPHTERLVPLDYILSSTAASTQLRCSPSEFADLEPFMKNDYLNPLELVDVRAYRNSVVLWPYGAHGKPQELENETHFPPGEVLIRRGSRVNATDGKIGKVDELLINPLNDQISHIIMREGHLWGHKDVTIPVSKIEKIADGVVHLKLDKQTAATLPGTPIHRKWK